jgi:hypothetical protein
MWGGKRTAGSVSALGLPWAFRSLADPESLIRNGRECYHTNGINVALEVRIKGLREPLAVGLPAEPLQRARLTAS